MNIMFEAAHGQRILRNSFMGISARRNDDASCMWWCYGTRKWVQRPILLPMGGSNIAPCNSYRAFLRHLRKHPELQGCEVRLNSRFVGCNIVAQVQKEGEKG
jgi:hypothetical protein